MISRLRNKSGQVRPADQLRASLNFTWLRPGALAGACQPGAWNRLEEDLDLLAGEGVRVVANLRERPWLLPADWEGRVEVVHFPILDFGSPTVDLMQEIAECTEHYLGEEQPLVFHCMAGIGRTGTVLAGLLMQREGLSADEAIAELARHRRGPQSERQRHFLEVEWARHLGR